MHAQGCVVLAEVDNNGIPSFATNIQSCGNRWGKKTFQKLHFRIKNNLISVLPLKSTHPDLI